jgi:hypothetical protein
VSPRMDGGHVCHLAWAVVMCGTSHGTITCICPSPVRNSFAATDQTRQTQNIAAKPPIAAHPPARVTCPRTCYMPTHVLHAHARVTCPRTCYMPTHVLHAHARVTCPRTHDLCNRVKQHPAPGQQVTHTCSSLHVSCVRGSTRNTHTHTHTFARVAFFCRIFMFEAYARAHMLHIQKGVCACYQQIQIRLTCITGGGGAISGSCLWFSTHCCHVCNQCPESRYFESMKSDMVTKHEHEHVIHRHVIHEHVINQHVIYSSNTSFVRTSVNK